MHRIETCPFLEWSRDLDSFNLYEILKTTLPETAYARRQAYYIVPVMSFGRRQGVVKRTELHVRHSGRRTPVHLDTTSRLDSGPHASARLTRQTLAALIGLAAFANWFSSEAMSATRNALSVSSIYEDAAREAIGRYSIARRQGDKVEVCLMAARAAAAYRKAKNEQRSRLWKTARDEDCAAAGLPRLP